VFIKAAYFYPLSEDDTRGKRQTALIHKQLSYVKEFGLYTFIVRKMASPQLAKKFSETNFTII
jgi:hypothetical protein